MAPQQKRKRLVSGIADLLLLRPVRSRRASKGPGMRFCEVSEGVSPSIKTLVKSIESDGKSSFDRAVDGESQTLIY